MPTKTPIVIVWFRQDLRLSDNSALEFAATKNCKILPLFILDDETCGSWKLGAASRWWLHKSLEKLDQSLDGHLCFGKGNARDIISQLIEKHNVQGVFWNRCYEPWRIKRDTLIKQMLFAQGIEAKSFNAATLFEPHQLLKGDGTPYKVFTPFYKNGYLSGKFEPRQPRSLKEKPTWFKHHELALDALALMPKIPWHCEMAKEWQPGEEGAQLRFEAFLNNGLKGYKEGRDYPERQNTSRLSPHLHFGEISPNQLWHRVEHEIMMEHHDNDGRHFLREICWREFSSSLLYHNQDMPSRNLNSKFDNFPWREDLDVLKKWQRGQTGYPIVDAGMRELWKTGYMHNRVRMIVGSFLVKNLMLDWRHGQQWFWDTLVDADLANNSASWQWIAGCGADAAPYFRIFNPITQGKRFDTNGHYVRRYVPELAQLSDKYIHCPWEAPEGILTMANIKLDTTYPSPIVDLKQSRARALEGYSSISKGVS